MKKRRKNKVWLNYILYTLWFLSMALLGFFFPFFTDNIDFFKIKGLSIEGLETIPPEVVVDEVKKFKNNWLFMNSAIILKNLNTSTGNSVKSVKIDRVFSIKGVELKILIEERRPIFTVIKDNSLYFFDENGTIFRSPYIEATTPIVYTHDIEVIKRNFNNLKALIGIMGNNLKEIYVTNLNTIAYTNEGLKINMPPIFLLDRQVVENIIIAFKVYGGDIIIKELDLEGKDMVIIRGVEKE